MFIKTYTKPTYQLGRVSYAPIIQNFDSLWNKLFDYEAASYNSRLTLNENDSQYTITLELPGFEQSEVNVTIEGNALLIAAKNKDRETSRELSLWEGIDPNKVRATMKNGLLTVILPKVEKVKPIKISVT